jgi:membrane protein
MVAHPSDEARAREHGRGRRASSPEHIPWQGWKDILVRAYLEFNRHRLLALAAGVAFYDLLAIFPAITALVTIYGFFASATEIEADLALLGNLVPADLLDVIREQIHRIASQGTESLSLTLIGAILISLWSANAGMKALFDALNVIYEEVEKRSFVRLNIASLCFTAALIALAVLNTAAIVVMTPVIAQLRINNLAAAALSIFRWLFLFAVAALMLSALYRFGPSRRPAKWRWLSIGSVAGAVSWLICSAAFSWYLGHFANYGVTYGSLGAAMGLMMWVWVAAIVILLGGQLNAEIEHQTARDSTIGDMERPLGRRGATMADTVGEAHVGDAV